MNYNFLIQGEIKIEKSKEVFTDSMINYREYQIRRSNIQYHKNNLENTIKIMQGISYITNSNSKNKFKALKKSYKALSGGN